MNNPHYLKSRDSSDNEAEIAVEAVENIPVTELNLNVPLKVIGQKRSDQYLKMSKQNNKKKSKKKKHKSERLVVRFTSN